MKKPFSACLAIALAGILPAIPAHAQDRSPAPAVNPPRDTVYVYERTQPAPYRSPMDALSLPELANKRDHFGRMQRNGFSLLMGGIGLAAFGVTLMIIGFNQNAEAMDDWENDPYSNEDAPTDGAGLIIPGYLATVISPALIIPGIILNRIGNGRRLRYEQEMNSWEGHGFRLDAGLNSLRLSYRF